MNKKTIQNISRGIVPWILLGVLLLWGVYFLFSDLKEDMDLKKGINKIKQEKRAAEDLSRDLGEQLGAKYQAIPIWKETPTYTVQAEKYLTAGGPILFKGYVDDVFNRDGKTYARFITPSRNALYYIFELECDKKVIKEILSRTASYEFPLVDRMIDGFAVVANIQEVTKPAFMLRASATTLVPTVEDIEIAIDPARNPFIARGTCIDILHIGTLDESEGEILWS